MSASKLRVAVIGAGRIGSQHARILGKLPDVELVGVCDTNMWSAQLVAWKNNTIAIRNYEDALKSVDAVVIAVPTPIHFEVGREALELGLHCLIEKPLAASVDEARQLLALSEDKKVVLQVGHVERFNPAVLEAIKHIRHPRFITVERLGPYDPRVAHIGVVLDLMIHDLDILLTLVGSEVESLEAIGAHLLSGHEDIANVRVRFKNGCVADVTASRVSLQKSRKLRVFGADSYISLDYASTSLKIYRRKPGVSAIRSLSDIDIVKPSLDKTEPLKNEHLHWLDCIRHSRTPWPSAERGVEALKLALQISDELERYHATGTAASPRPLIPEWVQDLSKIAKTVGKDILRS